MCSAFICFCLMFLQPEKILHIIAIMFASDVQIICIYIFLALLQHAGEEFFANRALMELVQRIRADNSLFEKLVYTHKVGH